MTLVFSENFDGVAAPAVPSGWTANDDSLVTATDQKVSGANSLKHVGPGTASLTRDTNVGTDDYILSAKIRLSAGLQAVILGVREQTTDPLTNDYNLSVFSTSVALKRRGNTTATLTEVVPLTDAPTNTWLYAAIKVEGNLISGKLQRSDTSEWLQTDGSWGATQVWATEATDSSWTTGGRAFVTLSNSTAQTSWVDDVQVDDLGVASGNFSAVPATVPAGHSGHLTVTLTGTGTTWGGGTTFTVSGVTGVTKFSQNVISATSATVTIAFSGSSTGTLTIGDGTATRTVTVSTPALGVSPGTQEALTSAVFTLTGTATVWDQESASGLFSVSGLAGATITAAATVASGLSATLPVDLGAATGTLTITDNSTGKTHAVTVSALADKLIVTDGNSLTIAESTTESGTGNWPTKLAALLQPDWLIVNVAQSGQTTQQMAADAASEIDPRFSADRSRCILIAWECRNDIVVNSITGLQAYQHFRDYCLARKAAGWHVVVLTMLPTSAVDETTRGVVNDNIRAHWRTFGHALADIAGDQRIGDGGDQNDTTYYYDGTHMKSAGYAIVAQYVAGAIGSVQTGGPDTGGNIKYWDGSAWVAALA